MKLMFALFGLSVLTSALAELPPESPISPSYIFLSPRCKITKVLTISDQVDISISGKLGTSDSHLNDLFRTSDRFLFSVRSSKSTDPQAFDRFARSMRNLDGAFVSLEITTKQIMLRGGMFILGFDISEFKITKTAQQDAAANP